MVRLIAVALIVGITIAFGLSSFVNGVIIEGLLLGCVAISCLVIPAIYLHYQYKRQTTEH